jgi:PPOX class probable F420-dependent enzyme
MAREFAPDAAEVERFLTERHLATFTISRPDGSLQVTPVGVTWDRIAGLARVITRAASYKARIVAASPDCEVALCQVAGRRWLTLYGTARVTDGPEQVAEAEARYRDRYRQPRARPDRVVIEVTVRRMIGSLPSTGTADGDGAAAGTG